MSQLFKKPTLMLIGSALIILFLAHDYLTTSPVFKIKEVSYLDARKDSIIMEREKIKLAKLECWYDMKLVEAKIHADTAELIKATEDFFLAKSIFPERMEPRMNLARIYATLCYDAGFFCYEAKREISYAYNYVGKSDHYSSSDLDILHDKIKEVKFEQTVDFIQ